MILKMQESDRKQQEKDQVMAQKKETGIVLRQEELTPGMFSMWIGTGICRDAAAGQFVTLYCSDASRLLPRPFGICDVRTKERDGEDSVRIVYRVAGEGTREFSEMKPGDPVDLMGPLGNGFPMQEPGKRAFLIGGGSGVPPIYHLAKRLNGDKTVILGYRDSNTFLAEEFAPYAPVFCASEDGSVGSRGNVLDAIRENDLTADTIYACGPMPMLRALKAYAEENGMDCYVSLEERMACGIGACLACVCRTPEKDAHSNVNNKRICKDGPVFDAREVIL